MDPIKPDAIIESRPLQNHMDTNLILADFEVFKTLGTGSFGRVHLVKRKKDGKYMAMKVLRKSEVVRLRQVEHVHNEKNVLTQCKHPFLVNMVGVLKDNVNLFVFLEYVSGGELFSYLRKFQVISMH